MPPRFLVAMFLLAGCAGPEPAIKASAPSQPPGPSAAEAVEERLTRLVDELEAQVAPLAREVNLAFWDEATGVQRQGPGLPELELRVRRVYARPELLESVARGLAQGGVEDFALRRRLALHLADLRENRVPWALLEELVRRTAELERRYFSLPFQLDGVEVGANDLYAVLQEERDGPSRRAAWEAFLARGAVVRDELLALVRLRNRAAQAAGFEDYYRMRLQLGELSPSDLEALLREVERRTEPAFSQELSAMRAKLARRHVVTTAQLRPWHFEDPFFAHAPRAGRFALESYFTRASPVTLARASLERLGAGSGALWERADLDERAAKRFGAFCLDVDRRGDLRILAHVQPGRAWTVALLHELGHALYRLHLDSGLPWGLRQPAHPVVSEAVAVLLGRLPDEPAWLQTVAGVPDEELRRQLALVRDHARREALTAVRFGLLVAFFEQELYRDPEQDLNALWRGLRLRLLSEPAPEGRDAPDWAALPHLLTAPVTYHHYVLAELLASQIQAWLERQLPEDMARLGWSSPQAFELLRSRWFSAGASLLWTQLVESRTGSPLSVEAFARQYDLGGAELSAPGSAR